MVTSIQLGNIFSSGDRQVLTGGTSGLDIESLVEGLVEAKRLPAVSLEETIAQNEEKITAYSELRSILDRFQSSLDSLRNPPGVQNDADNIFQYRTSALTVSDGSDADNYIDVSAQPGADVSSYTIEVDNIALADIYTSIAFTSDTASIVEAPGGTTAGMLSEGTFQLDTGGGVANITLDQGDTIYDVVQKVNNAKDTSGVEATVIQVADNDFRIQIKSVETGTDNIINVADGAGVIFDAVNVNTFTLTQAAEDAEMTFNGLTITRQSNIIDDVVDDVTFTLKEVTTGGAEITADIEQDVDFMVDSIVNFADLYNEFKIFHAQQTQRGENGAPLEGSYLLGESTLLTISNRISTELSAAVEGILDEDNNDLTDIGLELDDFPGDEAQEIPYVRNILTVDTDTLRDKLISDFEEVRKIFEFDLTSDSVNLTVFSRTNDISINDFTLDIDTTAETATATYDPGSGPVVINLDYTEIAAGSISLTGQEGTVLEGLVLLYSSTDSDTIDVSLTQGIGDRLYNSIDEVLEEEDGVIDVAVDSILDINESLEESITRIDEQIETYRDQLLSKFASLEAAISSVNSLLQALDAQQQARNNN